MNDIKVLVTNLIPDMSILKIILYIIVGLLLFKLVKWAIKFVKWVFK